MKFRLRNPDPLALWASVPENVCFPLSLTRHPGIWNWAVSSGAEGFPQKYPKDPPTMVFLPLTPPAYFFSLPPPDFGWSSLRRVIFPHQLQALNKWLVAWINACSLSLRSSSFPREAVIKYLDWIMETLIHLSYLPALRSGMVARPTKEKTSARVMPSQETIECVLQCYHSPNQNQLVLAFFFSTCIVGRIASWAIWDLLSSLKNWALCLFWFIFSKVHDWDDFHIILRTGAL